jgi:NADH:ubiquinone oxidoreductase subunit 4 (subunit M)
MNITTIGLFSQQTITLVGSFISMVSHSLVASGLFICAGTLYNRFGVYEIQYFGGSNTMLPKLLYKVPAHINKPLATRL